MPAPRVAVVLPVHRAAATLVSAVESVLTQTAEDFEILLIEDRCDPATREQIDRALSLDRRVKRWVSSGAGIVAALNTGLQHAKGSPYLARMDADDLCLPDRFERSLEELERHPSWVGCGTQVEVFREDRPVSPSLQAYARWLNAMTQPGKLQRERFIESPLCHPSAMIRTEALFQVQGWRDLPFPEDWDLWLRLLALGPLGVVEGVLFRWRDHPARLTRTDERYLRKNMAQLRAEHLQPLLHAKSVVICGATKQGLALARALRQRGVNVSSFLDVDPSKIGQTVDGIPVGDIQTLRPQAQMHFLLAVGNEAAREDLRHLLASQGLTEERDFHCVA